MTTFTCKTCRHTIKATDPEDAGDLESSPFACPLCSGFEWTHSKTVTKFHFTFGQKYRHEPHPRGPAHPDGWVTVEADNVEDAVQIMSEHYGDMWASCYTEHSFNPDLFPRGELVRLY